MLKTGRIVRGYLGVNTLGLTPEIAHQLGLPGTSGALVLGVIPGSPAERAGLQPRDLIRAFNGRPVLDNFALRERLAETDLPAKVTLGILREGREQTLTAEVVEAPAPAK